MNYFFKKTAFCSLLVLGLGASKRTMGQEQDLAASGGSQFSLGTSKSGGRLRLRVLGSVTQLKTSSFSVLAGGAGVDADYAFFQKWALNVGVSQALTVEDSLSALFTSLTMHWRYAILGRLYNEKTSHSLGKDTFLTSRQRTGHLLSMSLGLEQHFFNAASAIVPASGIGATLLYERFIWFIEASVGIRYAYLAFQGDTVSMVTGVLGFNWMF